MSTTDNPPAFPQNDFSAYTSDREGMTLRDYFAGQALAGRMSILVADIGPAERIEDSVGNNLLSYSGIAASCYAAADAMLAAREARKEGN